MRRIATVLGGALVTVFLTAGSVFAATKYHDTAFGAEVAATSTQGTFAGAASGGLPGSWVAVVDHTVLSPSATITGGTFVFQTQSGSRIDGTFDPKGTVSFISGSAGCTNQTYSVKDSLTFAKGATGTFTAVLTHYRTIFFGTCVTYGASVAGSLTIPD